MKATHGVDADTGRADVWFLRPLFWATVLIFLGLFAYKSMTRIDGFDPDMMNFLDVARNIVAGRGIAQSTLGFNEPRFPADDSIPAAFTSQPPLYPILVAPFVWIGIPDIRAAILVSLVCLGCFLWMSYRLCLELYDQRTAYLTVVLLLLYEPLYRLSGTAYSEQTGLAFLLGSLLSLARLGRDPSRELELAAVSGLLTGLAFATRYALLPLAAVGGAFVLLEATDRRRALTSYSLGFVAPAAMVLGHNWFTSGSIMPSPNQSTTTLSANIAQTLVALGGSYFPRSRIGPHLQVALLTAGLGLMVALLIARRQLAATLRNVFITDRRYVLPLWVGTYLIFLVYQRTHVHFDDIGPRFILPAEVVLIVMAAALLARTVRIRDDRLVFALITVSLLMSIREVQFVVRRVAYDPDSHVAKSQLLTWIAQNTTEKDLIIGDDTVYVPFYFGRTAAASFSRFPYSDYVDSHSIFAHARRQCDSHERVYLVLGSPWVHSGEDWEAAFGPFIGDVMAGRTQEYPDLALRRKFGDGAVFEFQCR